MHNNSGNSPSPGSPGWSRGPSSRQGEVRRGPSRSKQGTSGQFMQQSAHQDDVAARLRNEGDANQQSVLARIKETKKSTSIGHSRNAAQSSWFREWSSLNHSVKVAETEQRASMDVFNGKYDVADAVDEKYLSELGITDGTVVQWGEVTVEKEYLRGNSSNTSDSKATQPLQKRNVQFQILSTWSAGTSEAEQHRNVLRALLHRLRGGIEAQKSKNSKQEALVQKQLTESKEGMMIELDIFTQEQRALERDIELLQLKLNDTPKHDLKEDIRKWIMSYTVKEDTQPQQVVEQASHLTNKATPKSAKKNEYIRPNVLAETIVSGFDPDALQRSLGSEVTGESIDSLIYKLRRKEVENTKVDQVSSHNKNTETSSSLFLTEPAPMDEVLDQDVLQLQQSRLDEDTAINNSDDLQTHQRDMLLVYLMLCCVYCDRTHSAAIPPALYNYLHVIVSTIDVSTSSKECKELISNFLRINQNNVICTKNAGMTDCVNLLGIPLGVSVKDLQFVKAVMQRKHQTALVKMTDHSKLLVIPVLKREDLYAQERSSGSIVSNNKTNRKEQSRRTPIPTLDHGVNNAHTDSRATVESFDDVFLEEDDKEYSDLKINCQSMNLSYVELFNTIHVIPGTVLEALYPLSTSIHPLFVYILVQLLSILHVLRKKAKSSEHSSSRKSQATIEEVYSKCVDLVVRQRAGVYERVAQCDDMLLAKAQQQLETLGSEYKTVSRDFSSLDEELEHAQVVVEQTYKKMREEVRITQQRAKTEAYQIRENARLEQQQAEHAIKEELALKQYAIDMQAHKKRVEERRQVDMLKAEERAQAALEEVRLTEERAAQLELQRMTVAGPIEKKIKRDAARAIQNTQKQDMALEQLQDEQLAIRDMVRKMRALGVTLLPQARGEAFRQLKGFTEDRLNTDPRYKLQLALAQAGVGHSAYARQAFQSLGEGRERPGLQNQWTFHEQ